MELSAETVEGVCSATGELGWEGGREGSEPQAKQIQTLYSQKDADFGALRAEIERKKLHAGATGPSMAGLGLGLVVVGVVLESKAHPSWALLFC